MGEAHSSGTYFSGAAVKDHFVGVQTQWNEADLTVLINRLKDMTLNFSLDRVKFQRLLQLPPSFEALVSKWFEEFSHDRASQVVDGLEFLSASIMISSKVLLYRKICLLFSLFDLDKTGVIRKDEFTIFLKAVTTGLYRMVDGLPPPAPVVELGGHSSDFFATLGGQTLSLHELVMWMTEAHFSLHYLSCLSKLESGIFAWGVNSRFELGLNMEPAKQTLPAPLLPLEGVRITNIASSESHSLFLTAEGRVWSCGTGFCGILGHGDLTDCPQPRPIEALSHVEVVDVSVGVRHSVAVSSKGQVFTWGSDDLYQLGHGRHEDVEIYEKGFDGKTGGTFAYVTKPTVLMSLFGQKVLARRSSCCNFSTVIMTEQGTLYSWGNNTDGQCGQGHRCPDHFLVFVDPHMQRTAMQCIREPRRVETSTIFKTINCGGYHTLAIDKEHRLWSFGQGMWGKLGHGDQRSMYVPHLVESMKYNRTMEIAAGEMHSVCLSALYRLTITGSDASVPLNPFSLLGLPIGRVDKHAMERKTMQAPNTTLNFNAFVSARLMEVGLPFRHEVGQAIVNTTQYPKEDIKNSIILVERALWEGEWLKLQTTDLDFNLKMSSAGMAIPGKSLNGSLVLCLEGLYDPETDLKGQICIFAIESSEQIYTQETVAARVWELANQCRAGGGRACICILPKDIENFKVEAPKHAPVDEVNALRSVCFGTMSYGHGEKLRSHVSELQNQRVANSPDGLPDEVRNWKQCQAEWTGRPYYENTKTGEKRWPPPIVLAQSEATLVYVGQDLFLSRLTNLLDLTPKAIIICHQSWRPDVEMVDIPKEQFDMESLSTPIVQVSYEAGEELKNVCATGAAPWVTMEVQDFGGVYAWGNGTLGQLGLAGIENREFLDRSQNALTDEENSFTTTPCYVAHLHEHQVNSIACGFTHTTAVTKQGEVFAWGAPDGLGVSADRPAEQPMFVDQLEGLVRATKTFAGAHHSFVAADMPFKSVV
jgi:alpha-tubulin suppressor-like RCC1 family protein